MFKAISAAMVVLVVQSGNVLAATPYPVYPTESQYITGLTQLAQCDRYLAVFMYLIQFAQSIGQV